MDPAVLALVCVGFLLVVLGSLAFAVLRSSTGKAKNEDQAEDPQEDPQVSCTRAAAPVRGLDDPLLHHPTYPVSCSHRRRLQPWCGRLCLRQSQALVGRVPGTACLLACGAAWQKDRLKA